MALADYYLCDVCEGKTFYDANLNYEWDDEILDDRLRGVGEMKVICEDCSEKYEVVIKEKNGATNSKQN